ncbi:MAG: membrane integrity-associated transporter subunit PqiC [Verrucomicrobia bacterium]|nr:membrane integrity-associated transporter subunit PqiC [Verrucomicrobiota bacterium]
MTPRHLAFLCLLPAVLCLLLLAGCSLLPPVQADTTRYYVLTGPAPGGSGAQPIGGALRLGLKAVEIAPYLKKGPLVVRTGDNEVAFAAAARWAEPLDQEIARTLRLRLLAAPAVGRVFVAPFPLDEKRDFDVSVQVLRCEGVREGGSGALARFVALLELTTAGANGRVVARKNFLAPDAAWDGKDFARLAALLGDAVGALAQEVAATLPEKRPAE